jgi:tetratricopeptide (TPR) repeat protein
MTDDKTVVDYTTPRHARANFGLGERVTAGLYVVGVGRHGSAVETDMREFNSVYVFPESVEALVSSYGSRDPEEFLDKVRQKQAKRHVGALRQAICSVMYVGLALRSRGQLQESLDTFNRGLSLVPPAESAGIHAGAALVYHELGRYAEAEEAMIKAHSIAPDSEWVSEVGRRISGGETIGNTPSP